MPKRRRGYVVVTDRYCSDITLMRIVPFWFKKILLKVFPKPTVSIYLYNLAEVLHKRRPEESVEELNRQMEIFEKFNYSLKIKTIDKEKDIEKIICFVMKKILKEGF